MSPQISRMAGSRIRLLEMANGERHEFTGQFLVSYDPDFHLPDGSYDGGLLVCTPDRDKAPLFDLAEFLKIFKSGPSCICHRYRLDGYPNRPLSAFNLELG